MPSAILLRSPPRTAEVKRLHHTECIKRTRTGLPVSAQLQTSARKTARKAALPKSSMPECKTGAGTSNVQDVSIACCAPTSADSVCNLSICCRTAAMPELLKACCSCEAHHSTWGQPPAECKAAKLSDLTRSDLHARLYSASTRLQRTETRQRGPSSRRAF